MGWSAGRKLRQSIANLTKIVGIEYLTAARAIELRKGLKPAPATAAVITELRKVVGGVGPDRFLSPELQAASALVASGAVVEAAREVVAELI